MSSEARALTNDNIIAVLQLSGEIDLATEDAMVDLIFERLERRPANLVIDLSRVEFIGSTGLGVLIRAYQEANRIRTNLRIVANTPVVVTPLRISGLVEYLPVCGGVPEAMRLLGVAPRTGNPTDGG